MYAQRDLPLHSHQKGPSPPVRAIVDADLSDQGPLGHGAFWRYACEVASLCICFVFT